MFGSWMMENIIQKVQTNLINFYTIFFLSNDRTKRSCFISVYFIIKIIISFKILCQFTNFLLNIISIIVLVFYTYILKHKMILYVFLI